MTAPATVEHHPDRVQPWHDVHDEDKLATLIASMRAHGWTGPPVVTLPGRDYGWGPGDPIAVTGSHRIAAARAAAVEVLGVDLDELLRAHGTSLAEVDEQAGADPDDERHEEVVVRLTDYLPAEVVQFHGLDAH